MKKFVGPIIVAAALGGCVSASSSPELLNKGGFGASFQWCSGSPDFQLRNVPNGTATLDFRMTDLQVPSFPHGGGTVAYSGQKAVACGALRNYAAPSPPPPQVHDYEWEVRALDAGGKVLSFTKVSRKFPEK